MVSHGPGLFLFSGSVRCNGIESFALLSLASGVHTILQVIQHGYTPLPTLLLLVFSPDHRRAYDKSPAWPLRMSLSPLERTMAQRETDT